MLLEDVSSENKAENTAQLRISSTLMTSSTNSFFLNSDPLVGCAVFATFFIRFEANLSEYGSYSLHIRMFRYIRKQHFFASFASYSLQNIRTDSHTNIRFDAKNICCSEYSLQSKYSLKVFSYWRKFDSKL
jgi:hypothetical protein